MHLGWFLAAMTVIWANAQVPDPQESVPPAPVQPIPFSHKQHVALGLACKDCHEMTDPGQEAGLPSTGKCMSCHKTVKKDSASIRKLAKYDQQGRPVPWVPVYQVPDYVKFSHKAHVTRGQATCETCHGPVLERDVMRRETNIHMEGCMDCHRSKAASVACDSCHTLR